MEESDDSLTIPLEKCLVPLASSGLWGGTGAQTQRAAIYTFARAGVVIGRARLAAVPSPSHLLGPGTSPGGSAMHPKMVPFLLLIKSGSSASEVNFFERAAGEEISHVTDRRLHVTAPTVTFSRATGTAVHCQQRKDYMYMYRGVGRCVAINYWHKATRLDTRLGKKKRHREVNPVTGKVFYREHWRHVHGHVQYVRHGCADSFQFLHLS